MLHRAKVFFSAILIGIASQVAICDAAEHERPNIVLIFADDQGYADLGCYGAEGFETPNIDRLAAEGARFTDFYVAQPVCSASRAALLTGCYSNRVGILGALGPKSRHGINADELTLAELLQDEGYTTAIFGKWHLGHHPQFLPTQHGFDEYFGLPYSNDMWPYHPERPGGFPPLPLIQSTEAIETNPDQTQLTTWYTERAVDFIERNHKQPFFVYVPHSMPHVPLFVSDKHDGQTKRGLFGDVITEIDWSVGQIMDALRRTKVDDNTLVIYTSDNGPWLSYGDHAGLATPLREGKGTTFDGGVREPMVCRWPGHIPQGHVCSEPAMTIDILPTIAGITGAELPEERIIDGQDIWPLMAGNAGAKSPHEALYFYWGKHLQAVRSGPWKLHLPHSYRTLNGRPGGQGGIPAKYEQAEIGQSLFNLVEDIGETQDVSQDHPDVMQHMLELVERARADLGDSAAKRTGANVRQAGQLN